MVKESFFTFITEVFAAFCGLITAILTARILGAEGRGIFAFLQSLIAVSILLGGLGLSFANIYFISSKKYSLSVLFGNSLFVGVILGILLIAGIVLLNFSLPNLFQEIAPSFILLVSLSLPFYLIGNLFRSLLLGLQRIFSYNLTFIITRVITIGAFLVFLLIFPEVKTAVFILIFIGVIGFLVALFFLFKNTPLLKPRIDLLVIKDSIKFGLKGQLGDIAQTMDLKLGIFLINFFLNPTAVGIYSIALFLGTALKFVPVSLGTVLFPKVSAETKAFEAERLTKKCCRISLFFTFLIGIILAIFAPWIIKIFFGQVFMQGLLALRILIIGMIVSSIAKVLGSYIVGKGFPQYYAIAAFVALFFSFGFSLILIPSLGINGSAIAALISYLVMALMFIFFYKKISISPFRLENLLIPKKEDFRSLKELIKQIRYWRKNLH
ncbi:flippase [Patescibacteria group bacterium]|nr:flippase [Patescibacteria group bacterium]